MQPRFPTLSKGTAANLFVHCTVNDSVLAETFSGPEAAAACLRNVQASYDAVNAFKAHHARVDEARRRESVRRQQEAAAARERGTLIPSVITASAAEEGDDSVGDHNAAAMVTSGKASNEAAAAEAAAAATDTTAAEEPPEPTTQQQAAAALHPFRLPPGGCLSVMSAAAEYAPPLTRCHTLHVPDADGEDPAALHRVWASAVALTLACMGPASAASAAAAGLALPHNGFVVGVFLRRGARRLSVGVVTQCSLRHPALAPLLARYAVTLDCAVGETDAELPIGQGLRQVSLKVWWVPSGRRVTPNARIPPVKLVLEDHGHHFRGAALPARRAGDGGEDSAPYTNFFPHDAGDAAAAAAAAAAAGQDAPGEHACLKGYTAARLFLSRPRYGLLGGTTAYALPHTQAERLRAASPRTTLKKDESAVTPPPPPHPALDTTQPFEGTPSAGDRSGGEEDEAAAGGDTGAYRGEMDYAVYSSAAGPWPLSSATHGQTCGGVEYFRGFDNLSAAAAGAPRAQGTSCTARNALVHVFFRDITVGCVGEHLIGAEVTVAPAYLPFVPVICSHLCPFLVVATPDA